MDINWFQLFLLILALFVVLALLVTLGLALPPRPFLEHPEPTRLDERAPFLPGLPEPVRRHFASAIGENPPRINTAVVWGRGKAYIHGIWTPLRFKAWYDPGESFLRQMEFTFFLRPVMRGTERYAAGEGGFALADEVERGPMVDHDQALALWSEAVWMPPVFVHDPRLRWQAMDDHHALLVVPTRGGEVTFDAFFDPTTGCMTHLLATRTDPDTGESEPWRFDLLQWRRFHDLLLPCAVSLSWGVTGTPSLYLNVDGVAYNVDVSEKISPPFLTASEERTP